MRLLGSVPFSLAGKCPSSMIGTNVPRHKTIAEFPARRCQRLVSADTADF